MADRKPTNPENPKDMVGVAKWRQSFCISPRVMWGVGAAMLEGALKYGRYNYRKSGVRASIYVDAAKGHIDSWIEGEDIDADSRLHHLDKAIASLIVVRDSIYEGNFVDDRPMRHRGIDQQKAELQQTVDWLFERYGVDPARPITELEDGHAPEAPAFPDGPIFPPIKTDDLNTDDVRQAEANLRIYGSPETIGDIPDFLREDEGSRQ